MIQNAFDERLYRKFDQYDYQRYAIADYWYLDAVFELLTGFMMDCGGHHDSDNCIEINSKIYSNVYDYLTEGVYSGKLIYVHVITEDDYIEPGSVEAAKARVYKSDFINFIEGNNKLKLNIDRLKSVLDYSVKPVEEKAQQQLQNNVIQKKSQTVETKGVPYLKNAHMQGLAERRYKGSKEAKQELEKIVKAELLTACTCLSSQMKKYIQRESSRPESVITTSYKTASGGVGNISDRKLTELISKVFKANGADDRVQDKKKKASSCNYHKI